MVPTSDCCLVAGVVVDLLGLISVATHVTFTDMNTLPGFGSGRVFF